MYRYRARLDFELAKACISQQRIPPPPGRPSLADALNYACQLRAMRAGAKFRSRLGTPVPTEAPPFCSRQPEAISLLALRGKHRRPSPKATDAAPSPPQPASPGASWPRPLKLPPKSRPQIDDSPLPSERKRRIPAAVLNISLGLVVAVIAGLVIGRSGAFRLQTQDRLQFASTLETPPAAQPAVPPALPPPPTAAAGQEAAAVPTTAASPPPVPPETPAATLRKKKKPRRAQSGATAKPPEQAAKPPRPAGKKPQPKPAPPAEETPAEPFSGDDPSLTARTERATRLALAKCRREDSLIGQERCRWRVCGRRWGQDGCPSYENKAWRPVLGVVISWRN